MSQLTILNNGIGKIKACNFDSYRLFPDLYVGTFAERQGFEPWVPEKGTTVFETAPIDHSGIFPLAGFNDAKVCKIFNTSKTDFGYFEFVE